MYLNPDAHAFLTQVVLIAAAILKDAQVGIDTYSHFNFIRNFTPKPMSTLEVSRPGPGLSSRFLRLCRVFKGHEEAFVELSRHGRRQDLHGSGQAACLL